MTAVRRLARQAYWFALTWLLMDALAFFAGRAVALATAGILLLACLVLLHHLGRKSSRG